MEFEVHQDDHGTVIRLIGRLTFDDHQKFRAVNALAGSAPSRRLVLDLSGLEFIDSAGLGMLVVFKDLASRTQTPVFQTGARGVVGKLMDLIRFGAVIEPLH